MAAPLLTAAELQVLHLLGKGLLTRDIAKRLHRSYNTIAWYRQRIRSKCGVNTTTAALRIAVDRGIIVEKEQTLYV
jgi:DNA-binding NarL/FixJ family response regulator